MAPLLPTMARLYRTTPQTDAELLEQFTVRRDEAAFAALVQRHGPMVLGVCKRLLRDHGDAEDAFQATFLVLAQKAMSLTGQTSLAPWLHGVAQRTALRARSLALKRTTRHQPFTVEPVAPKVSDAETWEWQRLLEEELQRLPEKYRVPLVLHYLTGQTKAEAAAHLGVPEGTISSRLARGRESLQQRLVRRGVILTAGGIVPLFLPRPVAARLARTTAAIGGNTLAVSPSVLTLTQGVLRTMFLTHCRRGILLLLVLAVCGLSWGLLPSSAEDPVSAMPQNIPAAASEQPSPVNDFDQWWLLFQVKHGNRIALRADGKVRLTFPPGPATETHISPDGQWKAEFVTKGRTTELVISSTKPVGEIRGNEPHSASISLGGTFAGWSPNSQRLAFTSIVDGKPQIYVVNVPTFKTQAIKDGELGNIQPRFTRHNTLTYLALREARSKQIREDGLGFVTLADLQVTSDLSGAHTVMTQLPVGSMGVYPKVFYAPDAYAFNDDFTMLAITTPDGLYLTETPRVFGRLSLKDFRHVTTKSINPQWGTTTFRNIQWRPDGKALFCVPVYDRLRLLIYPAPKIEGEDQLVIIPVGGTPIHFLHPPHTRFVQWLHSEKQPTAEQFPKSTSP